MLRRKVVEWVAKGDFGLGSGADTGARPERVWFREAVAADEVTFDSGVQLLTKGRAEALKAPPAAESERNAKADRVAEDTAVTLVDEAPVSGTSPEPQPPDQPISRDTTLRVHGDIPAEIWNRLGTRLIPKLRAGARGDLRVTVAFELTARGPEKNALQADLRQILDDLQLADRVRIEAG